MKKHYIVYLPSGVHADEESQALLEEKFGPENVYPLSGGGAFVVKTDENLHFEVVMDRIGFNKTTRKSGVAAEINLGRIDGWHDKSLWSFINKEALAQLDAQTAMAR